jgi:hypothetical protein
MKNQNIVKKKFDEAIKLKDTKLGLEKYTELVADAYEKAPVFEPSAVKHWKALNESNYTLFKRLLSKIKVVFVTDNKSEAGKINISGKEYDILYLQGGQPYENQSEMKEDVTKNGTLQISVDYSDHPVFSVKDNIVFRTVHDYIVHILGNKQFGRRGELQAYNLHTKLVPREAVPALFTEVVGQVSVAVVTGDFPVQKIAALKGFDYYNIGYVEGYKVKDKELSTAEEDKELVEYGELYERLKKKINMLNNR